jgi:hypothetical protein
VEYWSRQRSSTVTSPKVGGILVPAASFLLTIVCFSVVTLNQILPRLPSRVVNFSSLKYSLTLRLGADEKYLTFKLYYTSDTPEDYQPVRV